MSDPIEAAWSAYAKAMNRMGPTVAEENAIRLAIAAYHAAAPSGYDLVKYDLFVAAGWLDELDHDPAPDLTEWANNRPGGGVRRAIDAIKALEARVLELEKDK